MPKLQSGDLVLINNDGLPKARGVAIPQNIGRVNGIVPGYLGRVVSVHIKGTWFLDWYVYSKHCTSLSEMSQLERDVWEYINKETRDV